ncbi:DUF3093 domain-containing protein [Paractinoplanes ferrugineus]|uniref:DUF3093 domain-containing protein n=1 Tax=Paractinoplanes ferrugineus TaxID=113564 RepID=A0A919IXW5_9ACTN|nr:DUF3093 domain-containing protein [Actinoplanes ferrugineus]GIE09313.1 hypothetical protein Afe05nite_11530 [Actinoplanes ferrugineus]
MTPESPARTTAPTAAYTERLGLSVWAWLGALVVDVIVGLEVLLGFEEMPFWLPFAFLLPFTAAFLLWMGRIRVTVTGDELQVDDARLPLTAIADVVALDAAGKREALGVGAHPLAFVIQRPWIGPAVQVLLDDPADPTPFWVISTRKPVELATALLTGANLR